MLLAFLMGCTSGTRTGQLTSSSTNPRIEYKHGSKIVVRYNAQQNKTFFSQDDIKISPDINIGSQKVNGTHAFEINSTAESLGTNSPPKKLTPTLLHDTPTKTGWQYPRPAKFAMFADGQPFELLCIVRTTYDSGKESEADNTQCLMSPSLLKDDPSDVDYYEALFMDISLDKFVVLGNATTVQVHIGAATFELPKETILAFRDFAEAMAGK